MAEGLRRDAAERFRRERHLPRGVGDHALALTARGLALGLVAHVLAERLPP